jgi:hypothetical protein
VHSGQPERNNYFLCSPTVSQNLCSQIAIELLKLMLQCSVSLLVSKEDEETFGMVGESVQSHGCNKPCYEHQWTIAALCTRSSLVANKSDLHTEDDGIPDTS